MFVIAGDTYEQYDAFFAIDKKDSSPSYIILPTSMTCFSLVLYHRHRDRHNPDLQPSQSSSDLALGLIHTRPFSCERMSWSA